MARTSAKAKAPVQLMAANSLLAEEKAGALTAPAFSENIL